MLIQEIIDRAESEFDKDIGIDFFRHLYCECEGCDAKNDSDTIKQFLSTQIRQAVTEAVKSVVPEKIYDPWKPGFNVDVTSGYNQAINSMEEEITKLLA